MIENAPIEYAQGEITESPSPSCWSHSLTQGTYCALGIL